MSKFFGATMVIYHDEEWVQIAKIDGNDQIMFTDKFQELTAHMGWEAKGFIGYLIGFFNDEDEHLLDYRSGEAKYSKDQPGYYADNSIDGPQEIVEYVAEYKAINYGSKKIKEKNQ